MNDQMIEKGWEGEQSYYAWDQGHGYGFQKRENSQRNIGLRGQTNMKRGLK